MPVRMAEDSDTTQLGQIIREQKNPLTASSSLQGS
ncbi:unnamed protein product [Rhodiola kirilowii]